MNDDLHYANNLDRIEANCPCFYQTLKKRGIEAVMVTRVGMDEETDGYLICAEPHSLRIWQDEECAAVYFLAKLLAAHIRIGGEKWIDKKGAVFLQPLYKAKENMYHKEKQNT